MTNNLNSSHFHLPYNPKLVERAKELRQNMTAAEKKLWYGYLRTFKFRILRQRPIDHYIVDFYCPHLKLVIEIDGDSHFTETAEAYDEARSHVLESYGLTVVRFTNHQVLREFESVREGIEGLLVNAWEEIPPAPLEKGGEE